MEEGIHHYELGFLVVVRVNFGTPQQDTCPSGYSNQQLHWNPCLPAPSQVALKSFEGHGIQQ